MILNENSFNGSSDAIIAALEGDILSMNTILDYNTSPITSAERKKIENIGYTAAVTVKQSSARGYALKGDTSTMYGVLDLTDIYGRISGQDTSEERKKIEYLGQTAAVPVKLSSAIEYALDEKTFLAKTCLDLAIKYAEITNQDISAQVAEIKALISE